MLDTMFTAHLGKHVLVICSRGYFYEGLLVEEHKENIVIQDAGIYTKGLDSIPQRFPGIKLSIKIFSIEGIGELFPKDIK